MSDYRMTGLEIVDLFGTKYFKLAPGTVTILQGSNGAGKSSILKAPVIIFEGGFGKSVV